MDSCNVFFRSRLASVIVMLLLLTSPAHKAKAYGPDSKETYTVYVFLLETCPICQSATHELIALHNYYQDKGVTFVGLFPNTKLSNDSTIQKFNAKYKLPFSLELDTNQQIALLLGATITPQVFVVRHSDKQVLYSGRIDNSFESLGKKRRVVTEHNLKQALDNILQNIPVQPATTKPVGCFISKL